MPKYRQLPVEVEATQWFKNGDHPEDDQFEVYPGTDKAFMSEGKVVRYFRRPDVDDAAFCGECNHPFFDHGWIDTLEDGHRVCPGDWIITGVKGELYPCKPDTFGATYEEVDKIPSHVDPRPTD